MGKKRMSLSRLQALAAQTTIDTTLYESAVDGTVQQTGNFTVPVSTNLAIFAPSAGTYTGSIAISSMTNGQQLTIICASGNGFLLSSSDAGKILTGNGQTMTNTSSLSAMSTTRYVKLDAVGATPHVLIRIFSGTVG